MAETKKKSIIFVVGLVVLAALIVILAASLSACSNDDNANDPAPTETAQPEATTEPTSADAAKDAAGDATVSGGKTGTTKQPAKSTGTTGSSNSGSTDNGGSKDNGRDKIDYIMNYGDNVENGVETAADNFVGSLKDIGNAYDKGNVDGIMNTVGDFSKGLGDFLGGVKDSIIP